MYFFLHLKFGSPNKVFDLCLRYRLFWLILVIVSFIVTVTLSLESLHRYETKSTVVSIERDHYYWNTTLPSFTICPMVNRIDKQLFNAYCEKNRIIGTDKEEFYKFIESMANATYETFHLIEDFKSVEVNRTKITKEFYSENRIPIEKLFKSFTEIEHQSKRLYDVNL